MKKNNINHYEKTFDKRWCSERRRQGLKSAIPSFHNSRRIKARRQDEVNQGYYIDIYEKWIGLNVIAITFLSAVDAFFTLNIIDRGGIEVNPFMSALLEINTNAFLIGKFVITIVCLLFSLVHIKFQVLKVLPMKYMLFSITVLYLCLIRYELFLLEHM